MQSKNIYYIDSSTLKKKRRLVSSTNKQETLNYICKNEECDTMQASKK